MEDNKPNYYAIITAEVRYDKRLKANAKLLFAEISALTNKEGYCWAANDYFADLYEVTERNIQQLLKNLKDFGYIDIEVDQSSSKKRKIFIYSSRKNFHQLTKKFSPAHEKIFTPSIYSINTKNNIPTAYEFLEKNFPARLEQDFLMPYKKQFKNDKHFDSFIQDFNDEVESQGKSFDQTLFGMLKKYCRNWLRYQSSSRVIALNTQNTALDKLKIK